MERDTVHQIQDLQIGDRFCFPGDRQKGIASEVLSKNGAWVGYKKDGKPRQFIKGYKRVIFLRSNISQ